MQEREDANCVCPNCGYGIESHVDRDPISFGEWDTEKESVAFIKDIGKLESGNSAGSR